MSYEIRPIAEVPTHLLHPRKEVNLLWYGPSKILGAYNTENHLLGVIRLCKRIKTHLNHGLIADLHLDAQNHSPDELKHIATALIRAAEKDLRTSSVTKIDAAIIDGSKLAQHFIDAGYWASRKMVVIEWDLNVIKPPKAFEGIDISFVANPDVNELTEFIISSYQPYWRWWKDDAFDRLWDRVDYPDYTPDQVEIETTEHNREQMMNLLEDATAEALTGRHIFAVARKNKKIIGMCDAKIVEDSIEDCSDWGVLIQRDHPGKGFGQLLLLSCLNWLKKNGVKTATITTTSGLDDYDPTVYLYVQSCGGKIKGEFNNFVKRRF